MSNRDIVKSRRFEPQDKGTADVRHDRDGIIEMDIPRGVESLNQLLGDWDALETPPERGEPQ